MRDKFRFATVGLGALWLIVQGGLFLHLGIRFGKDTPRYLDAAESLLRGNLPAGVSLNYLTYDLFLAFSLWSGLGKSGVVLVQVLLTLLSAYCLYRLALRMYDEQTGYLAVLFYIVYADIHIWNFYILPDSLFLSMTIISLFAVSELRGWRLTVLSFFIITLTFGLNPHGIAILLAVILYGLFSLWNQRKYKVLLGVVCVLAISSLIAVKLIGPIVDSYNPAMNFAKGTVISAFEESYVRAPATLTPNRFEADNSLFSLLFFMAENPMYSLRVVGSRLWYFFLHIRPFYSDLHNYIILLTLIPSYALATLGALSPTKDPKVRVLLLSLCGFQTVVVALTFVTWDGRYLLMLLPIVFLFAAHGTLRLWRTVKRVRAE